MTGASRGGLSLAAGSRAATTDAPTLTIRCAWCRRILVEGDPAFVSDGICESCAAPLLAAVPTSKGTNR